MCATSAVFDQWRPYIPQPYEWRPQRVAPGDVPLPTQWTPEQLRKLLDSFRDALEAAEKFDLLTGQPDCVDPEKAKLEERVAELERKLEALGA